MKHTRLKGNTEGLNTRYCSKHIIQKVTADKCRMCNSQPETVEHIISGCQILATD